MDGTSMMTTTTVMVGQPPLTMATMAMMMATGVPLPTMTIPTMAVDPRAASPVDVARAAEDAAAHPVGIRLIITTITMDTGCGTARAARTVPRVGSLEVRVVKLVVVARAARASLKMMMMMMNGPPPPAPTMARVASLDIAEDPRAARAIAAGRPRAPAHLVTIVRVESLALVEDPREASVASPVEDATMTMTGPPLAGIRPTGMVDGDMTTMTITITPRVASPAVEAREASLAGTTMTMMIGRPPVGPLPAPAGPRAVAAVAPSLANLEAMVARAGGNLTLQPLLCDLHT
mmetsp:Transcript_11326/g.24145  ORF Transcript_11326/g.24145 Transcript_11326/m.24145 type:complete len:291 (+) Transcript_11326:264-1136(+)